MYLEEKRDFENAVIERAYKDEDFRAALTSGNASAAISEAFGRELSISVNVLSDSADTINIVLPNFDTPAEVELTEEQLAEVAGGVDICGWTCAVTSCGNTGCGSHSAVSPISPVMQ